MVRGAPCQRQGAIWYNCDAMQRSNKFWNPFYGLLLAAGIMFAVTATAYGVMAFRDRQAQSPVAESETQSAEHPLMSWMRRNGETALSIELFVLALGTVGAIATDDYWQRRSRK